MQKSCDILVPWIQSRVTERETNQISVRISRSEILLGHQIQTLSHGSILETYVGCLRVLVCVKSQSMLCHYCFILVCMSIILVLACRFSSCSFTSCCCRRRRRWRCSGTDIFCCCCCSCFLSHPTRHVPDRLACFVWFFPWDCASKPASKLLASLKNCYVMH